MTQPASPVAVIDYLRLDPDAASSRRARVLRLLVPNLTEQQSRDAVDLDLSAGEARHLLTAGDWPTDATIAGLKALRGLA
jgi:hypothetical protein